MITKLLPLYCVCVALLLCSVGGVQAESYGLGREVDADEIKLWDIDVRPDGTGLPAGDGSVEQGENVYRQHCLSCHGERGVGGVNDQLVGRINGDEFPFGRDATIKKTVGNYWPYASTLFDYIRRAMPYTQPGVLSDDEVYSVTAYLLHLNQLLGSDSTLDAKRLRSINMPAQDRFVNDDRTNTEFISAKPDGKKK
ncbi:MAG: c-type cytochrome [Pseudomonadales bacterium]